MNVRAAQIDATTAGQAGSCAVLVINLDRSPDRLAFQHAQAQRLGYSFERIAAVDGKTLAEDIYRKYAYRWQRPLKRTEVACLLSHAECWRRAVELGHNSIVLEDDAVLAGEIVDFVAAASAIGGAVAINLETRADRRFLSTGSAGAIDGGALYELCTSVAGAAAYLVTPAAAKALLDGLPTNATLADIYVTGFAGVRHLQLDPALGVGLDILQSAYGYAISTDSQTTIWREDNHLKDRAALTLRHPILRARRVLGQIRLGAQKLKLKITARRRVIKPYDSLFANYTALKGISHG